jgi:hypothetical protein
MAEMTIRLVVDPGTGEQRIVVELASDASALPMEHEQEHQDLLRKLLAGGGVELGNLPIEIRRETVAPTTTDPAAPQQRQQEPQRQVEEGGCEGGCEG